MLLTEHPVPLLRGHLQPNIVYPALHLRGLVRTQEFLRKNTPSVMNQALDTAIKEVLEEWGWT
jgi:hypothetical protein